MALFHTDEGFPFNIGEQETEEAALRRRQLPITIRDPKGYTSIVYLIAPEPMLGPVIEVWDAEAEVKKQLAAEMIMRSIHEYMETMEPTDGQ